MPLCSRSIAAFALLYGSLFVSLAMSRPAGAADFQPGLPFTYLFDTGTVSPEPLAPGALAERKGWAMVPENELAHVFRGDAVILNDNLAAVLRAKGRSAEIYAQADGGLESRAALMAIPTGATGVTGLAGIRTVENSPGAVRMEATLATQGGAGRATLSFRLTAGQNTIEILPGEAADRLFVWCRPAYVVVPDFFADDMVFGPEAVRPPRIGLPAENFFLNLIRGGDAILMCLWKSNGRQTAAIAAGNGPRVIEGCEIDGTKGEPLWVAFFEGRGLWYEQQPHAEREEYIEQAGSNRPAGPKDTAELAICWKPPFPAQWRADFIQDGGTAESWTLAQPDATGAAGDRKCVCRVEPDRTVLSAGADEAKSVVVYPLDRDRATPLTVFCPTDAIRNTLGVGPCQYILQTEGLATETNPTPDQVMTWIESQFERKRDQESAEEIRTMLTAMVELVAQTQARIEDYAQFAERVRPLAASEKPWTDTVQRIEKVTSASPTVAEATERARRLADDVARLIGQDNRAADCRRLGTELRGLGAEQDRTLSRCRTLVRWLAQQAALHAEEHDAVEAAKVWTEAARVLRNK